MLGIWIQNSQVNLVKVEFLLGPLFEIAYENEH